MTREFRLTLNSTYLGVEIANVFHFTSGSNLTGQATHLNQGFISQWLPFIQDCVHVDVDFTSVYSIDTNTLTDYNLTNIALSGQRGGAGSALPAFTAFSFTLNTTGSVIRHGFKRFAGVNRDDLDDGEPNGVLAPLLNDLALKLNDSIAQGGYVFVPIVPRYNNAEPPVMTAFTAVTGAAFRRVSTQNSRKT